MSRYNNIGQREYFFQPIHTSRHDDSTSHQKLRDEKPFENTVVKQISLW
jgi:hypothetical protein